MRHAHRILLPIASAVLIAALTGCATGAAPSPSPAVVAPAAVPASAPAIPRRPMGPLTDREMELARTAWQYFRNNYQPATGFVNSADGYPSTTMWDLASSFAGTVSAYELGLIQKDEFDQRIGTALASLGRMDLFRDEMPNKAYNSATLAETTYTNQPGEIGYSAIDIGRMLIWLRIIRERYPQHMDAADRAVMRWNFCNVVDQWGTLFGTAIGPGGEVQYLQEGRLGYEEYAAKGLELWGFDATRAAKPEPFTYTRIYDFQIPHDKRDPRDLGAHNYVVSESYVLDALELDWDLPEDTTSAHDVHTDAFLAEHGDRIFLVQKERHRTTGILTARTEHQLDEAPYFVYDTIYTDGAAWNTITETGAVVPKYAALSAKAAIGLWTLWDDPYSELLYDAVRKLAVPTKGIYEGAYEDGRGPIRTFTANNNGIILEALLYRRLGKLLPSWRKSGPWEASLTSARDCTRCRPQRRREP